MSCTEVRERIGADPDSLDAATQAHLQTCAECRAYLEQMRSLNAKLRQALQLDIPPRRAPVPLSSIAAEDGSDEGNPHETRPIRSDTAAPFHPDDVAPSRPDNVTPSRPDNVTPFRKKKAAGPPRWLAIGVSVAAGLLVGFTLWLGHPGESLAVEIVHHVEGEPDSWSHTQSVTTAELEKVLRKSAVHLGPGMQPVVYAHSCWFLGHYVPHMVVLTPSGPVTVLILKHQHVAATQQFQADGYSGLLVPVQGAGSVAVLSRTPMQLEQPATEVVHALEAANR